METFLPSAPLPGNAPAPAPGAGRPSSGPDGSTPPRTGFDQVLRASATADGSPDGDESAEPAAAAASVLLTGLLRQAPAAQPASCEETPLAEASVDPAPEPTEKLESGQSPASGPALRSEDAGAQITTAAASAKAGPGASADAPAVAGSGHAAPEDGKAAGEAAAPVKEAAQDRQDASAGQASRPQGGRAEDPAPARATAAPGDGASPENASAPDTRCGTIPSETDAAAASCAEGAGRRVAGAEAKETNGACLAAHGTSGPSTDRETGAPGRGIAAAEGNEGDGVSVAAHETNGGSSDRGNGAAAVQGASEADPSADAARRKRDEAGARVAERPETSAPQNAAPDRNPAHAAEKAAAPRQVVAPPAPRPVQIGENAFVLTRRSDNSVEVTLAPPGVGKLEIQVVLEKGVVHANITAADTAGREAIVNSLPHILDALARDGMAVGGFTVSLKDRKGPAGESPARTAPRPAGARPVVSAVVPTVAASLGRVDLFV